MKKQVTYTTDDGKVFGNELDALRHENDYLRSKKRPSIKHCINANLVPNHPGIYLWVSIDDNYKRYVGSTTNLRKRYKEFLNKENSYSGKKIDEARLKSGDKDSFWTYTILELCEEKDLKERENYYISVLETRDEKIGYNMQDAFGKRLTQKQQDKDSTVPGDIKTKYIAMRNQHRTLSFSLLDFYDHLQKIEQFPVSGVSCLTFRIKNMHNKSDETLLENLSVISKDLSAFLKGGARFSYNSFPPGIKLDAENKYAYTFYYNKKLYTKSFDTPQEAYQELLAERLTLLKFIAENDKQYIDRETYLIIKEMTIQEMEWLTLDDFKTSYLS